MTTKDRIEPQDASQSPGYGELRRLIRANETLGEYSFEECTDLISCVAAAAPALLAEHEALAQENERLKGGGLPVIERRHGDGFTRYHLTGGSILVESLDGPVTLGEGWLAITETEYANLREAEASRDAAISALSRLRGEVVEVLRAASYQFKSYEAQHRAKGPPEADAKADVNRSMAVRMDNALASIKGKET